MQKLITAALLSFACVLTVRFTATAQTPATASSPAWAYGLPPESTPATAKPAPPAGGAAGAAAPRAPDTSLKRIPGSSQEFTLAHIRDYWDVGDWFPDD